MSMKTEMAYYAVHRTLTMFINYSTIMSYAQLVPIFRIFIVAVSHNFRCLCNNCENMPTQTESKCCKSTNIVDGKIEAEDLSCITDHDGFQANCLNIHVLEVAYYDYVKEHGPREENQRIHE